MQLGQFQPHLHPQQRVQVRQGFVKQEHLGVTHQRPPNRHALPLPARQFRRAAVHQRFQLQHLGHDIGLFGLHCLGCPGQRQRKADVLPHGQMRIKRIVLKHHRDPTPRRFLMRDIGAVDADIAFCDGFQPGNHAQQGGFATARRPQQCAERAILNLQVQPAHHLDSPVFLGDGSQFQRCHALPLDSG